VEGVDATNTSGGTPPPNYGCGYRWYEDRAVAAGLSDIANLLAALKSGSPLFIASATFGVASHRIGTSGNGDLALTLQSAGGLHTNALNTQFAALRAQKVAAQSIEQVIDLTAQIDGVSAALDTLGRGPAQFVQQTIPIGH